jgi:hypothetical protein
LLRQKAANQAVDERKVVSMFDRSAVDPNKTIVGGRNVDETEDEIRRRLMDQNKKGIKALEERVKKNKEYQDLKKSFEDPEERANGGRIGYKLGTGKKSVEGLLDLIRNKFGKKSITTADKAPIPPKTLERDMFKKADENFKNKRMLDDDEYQDFLDEVGGADQLEAYDFDGTVGDAKRILKEQKQYMDDMELEYKKGNLDPKPGEKGRKEFLQKKLDEVEASGDQRLMTPDEIEELSSLDSDSQMDVVKTLAPKMVERLQLKKKYPGITDDLLDKILIDDNMQRKAEVLATIDEAFKMMEKGKSTDEILDTMKNVTRTKQADGGRIGLFKGAQADTKKGKAMSPGTSTTGSVRDDNPFTRGGGDNNNNPPPVQTNNKLPIQTTSDDSVNRGFLSDVRKKNQQKYLGILNKYKPDDFDALYNLDPTAITEEDSKFLKSYGVGTVYKDLSKTNIENFFDIFPKGVPPKKDPTSYSGDYKYNFAKLNDMGRIQLRNLEKKKGMESHGGDPFTDKDQQMLDELQRRDADPDKTYGPVFAADGGRIGLKAGSVDKMRRLILKTIGAGTAGIAGAKSGIFSFGKGAGKEVAKEVAQQTTTSTPPPYFFKLAEKIKMLGDDATATTDRTIAKTLKSKDGKSTYVLEEDVTTGDTIIKKINKEGDEMITDVEIMELKKGEVVMGKDGKPIKVPDEYEEVTEANARIEGDTFNDPYYTDGIQVDDIIKEVDDKVPSIKYASGGLAYMLGE